MKKSEQRWMHIKTGFLVERGTKPAASCANDYRPVTVTWDEPEMETVEVTKWGVLDPPFNGEEPRLGATFYNERDDAFERLVRQYRGRQAVKIVYTYTRPKPEPEPVEFTGKVYDADCNNFQVSLDAIFNNLSELNGKRVIVRLAG